MFYGRSWNDWIAEYSESHQNPVNRLCHTVGIPLIGVSVAALLLAIFIPGLWLWGLIGFVLGWVLQFIGHAVEGKPPEFLKDWRFLFVGARWWLAKMRGRA